MKITNIAIVLLTVDLTFVEDLERVRVWVRPCPFLVSLVPIPVHRETA